ncbi:MAG: methylated-DNA--[protein]-cysteine S-methyltransferase [Ignavibacteriae bacterium]|nr:methylated-DNA--[protein]-cysteine S-methyltransferase [Ignavibacteriota bacterium]
MSDTKSTYRIIWETVKHIPKGKAATYGEVAEQSGFPHHARLVGYALHNLPDGSSIPWHRVINSKGEISLRTVGESHNKQRKLLEKEGVKFNKNKVDLKKYGWLRKLRK